MQPREDPNPLVIVSSDTSAEDLPPPEPQQPPIQIVDLESSLEELHDLNMTVEFPPPLQHQVFREAYVLLDRLQVQPQRPLTPPPEHVLAVLDAPQIPLLQQPEVAQSEFVPQQQILQPPPMPPVDWAMVAHALFAIAEREHQLRLNHPN